MSDEFPSNPGSPLSIPEAFAVACGTQGPLDLRAIHRPTGAARTFTLRHPYALLGRGQRVQVRLDDPSVSQCHAYLQVIEGRPYLADLGSRTGVVWEDGSRGRGWMTPGRGVRVGAFDLFAGEPAPVSDPLTPPLADPWNPDAEDPELNPEPAAVLEVFQAGGIPAGTFPIDQPLLLVGRHPSCQLRFTDDSVGYFHCALVNTRDGVWLVDVFSQKGTRLNGRPTRLARVRDCDLIELGKASLVVRSGAGGGPLTVWGTAAVPPATRPPATEPAALSLQLAESVAGAFTPVREMMQQFQQCMASMAGMLAAQQQDHASLACEQMRLIQELVKELRELRGEIKAGGAQGLAATALPAAPQFAARPTPAQPLPSVKTADGVKAQALTDAHSWFLQQLAKFNQPSAPVKG
jgi:pSer/pThr/pTyr-binding forkhead associated (FHA) protein